MGDGRGGAGGADGAVSALRRVLRMGGGRWSGRDDRSRRVVPLAWQRWDSVYPTLWHGGHAWPSFATKLVTDFFLGEEATAEAALASSSSKGAAVAPAAADGCDSCGWDAEWPIGGACRWRRGALCGPNATEPAGSAVR
eukprot:gene22118-31796_t